MQTPQNDVLTFPPWAGAPGPDDRELMRRAVGGDREAYGLLFRRHADRIWRMAYLLLHDSASADDALQEAFTRGLVHLGTWRGDGPPHVWFYTIALNVCRRALREGAREEPLPAEREPAGRGPGVLTSVIRREHGRRLALMLGYLTEVQREVFVLHYVERLPYDQIAAAIGMSPGAARQVAHRARLALRGLLEQAIPA